MSDVKLISGDDAIRQVFGAGSEVVAERQFTRNGRKMLETVVRLSNGRYKVLWMLAVPLSVLTAVTKSGRPNPVVHVEGTKDDIPTMIQKVQKEFDQNYDRFVKNWPVVSLEGSR